MDLIKNEEKQIFNIIKYVPLVVTTLIILFFSIYIYIDKKQTLENEIKYIEEFFINEHKERIKDELDRVFYKINAYISQNPDLSQEYIKQKLLNDLSQVRYNNGDGYYFILSPQGKMILHINENYKNKNLKDIKDENGFKFIEKMIEIALEKKEGYISYKGVIKPSSNKVSLKTTYIKYYKPWEWIIGVGYYSSNLEKIIEEKKDIIQKENSNYLKKIGYIFIIITLILFLLSKRLSEYIQNKFVNYKKAINIQNKKLISEINKTKEYEKVIFTSNLVSITDKDGIILYANDEFCKITQYTQNELIGQNHNILKSGKADDSFYKDMWETITTGKVWRGICANKSKSGKLIYLNTIITPVKNDNGDIEKYIATRFDITSHIKAQNELMEKESIITQQSKMAAMGEMIAAIIHQWRQPLSLIATASSGVKMQKELGVLTDELLDDSMEAIRNSVKNLNQTIEDFRNFFSPNKQKIEFSIVNSIDKTLRLVDAQFDKHQILVVKNIDDINYFGLENELLQVLINILNNAKDQLIENNDDDKYVFIETKEFKDKIEISIKDNGGGIPQDIIAKIFNPYFTTKDSSHGTGIGLYMSKIIIEKNMGGVLKVGNEEYIYNDKKYIGAQFTIELLK